MNTLNFYSFNEARSMSYINYELLPQTPPKNLQFQQMHFHPPILHNYSYFYINNNRAIPSHRKKTVSWNNNLSVAFTYSKDDYDRTIDSRQIRSNVNHKYQYMLMKTNPGLRDNTVFEVLTGMDLDKQ